MVIEFGPDATPCNCGNIGCMEANASSWALPIFAHKDPLFETSMLKDLDVIDYRNLKACADKGDELVGQAPAPFARLLERQSLQPDHRLRP